MRIPRLVLAAAALFLVVVAPFPSSAQEIPSLTGPVVDQADMISPEDEERIGKLLLNHLATHGDQVVVATIENLGGEPIETVSLRIARTWGLGQGTNDNGVLILIAKAERKLRIEVGAGLSHELSDRRAEQIIRTEIVPFFKQGQMADGIQYGVVDVLAALRGEGAPEVARGGSRSSSGGSDIFIVVIIVAIFFVFFMFARAVGQDGGVTAGHRRDRDPADPHYRRRRRSMFSSSRKPSSGRSSFGGFSGGFSGGGGSFSGGGASGSW